MGAGIKTMVLWVGSQFLLGAHPSTPPPKKHEQHGVASKLFNLLGTIHEEQSVLHKLTVQEVFPARGLFPQQPWSIYFFETERTFHEVCQVCLYITILLVLTEFIMI